MQMIAGLTSTEYHRRYYHRRRAALIALLGDSCVWCGTDSDLQFDHIDPDQKSFDISDNMTASNPVVVAEIMKCQLLCKSCHLEKSRQAALEIGFVHGGVYGWMKRKCECDMCVRAKREWQDKRNAARRSVGSGRAEYGRPAEHGEILMYRRGCKCLDCKAANAAYARDLWQKKRAA